MKDTELVKLIIDNLEGGYYHPDMQSKLRNGVAMLDSGETMFGIDREAGGSDVTTSEKGKEFWALVDSLYSNYHSNTAYYNDKADGKRIAKEYGEELRRLCADMMLSRLERYAWSFLSEKSRQLISKSDALKLQFLYACWNGSGNFQRFANAFNNAVASGVNDSETLWQIVQDERIKKGGLFADGAAKLETIKEKYLKSSSFPWGWVFFAAAFLGVLIYNFKGDNNNDRQ